MDGTIANLYMNNWLEHLRAFHTKPYREAKTLVNAREFTKVVKELQKQGYKIGIISWLSKCNNKEYNKRVRIAKKLWLQKHFTKVDFDTIHIVKYGTNKNKFNNSDILFDDEEQNRAKWNGINYNEKNIIETLKKLLTK